MSKKTALMIASLLGNFSANAWDERPGSDDHRHQDRLFRDCQRETGASDYERNRAHDPWYPESSAYDTYESSRDEIGTCGRPENNGCRD